MEIVKALFLQTAAALLIKQAEENEEDEGRKRLGRFNKRRDLRTRVPLREAH